MVNYNGDLLPSGSQFLNQENRGIRFGDALLEEVKYNGKGLLFWEDHYFRLMASMRRLRMEIPMEFTMEYLEEQIRKTLKAANLEDHAVLVHLVICRKPGGDWVPEDRGVDYSIGLTELRDSEYILETAGNRADLFRDYYIQADALSGLRHNNKIQHVLAGIYAAENDLDTCILLNHEKSVAEALDGNLFLRKGEQISTPPLSSGCRDGILRKQLLKIGKSDSRYRWQEEAISPFALQQADELFVSSVRFGLRSITDYRKASYGSEAAAYACQKINNMLNVLQRVRPGEEKRI